MDYDALTPDQFEDPDFDSEEFTIGGKRRIHLGHLKLPEWLKEVRQDKVQLQFLLEKTSAVKPDRDGKLAELRTLIERKVKDPSVNRDGKTNRKVLVFTAFADTAHYFMTNWPRGHKNDSGSTRPLSSGTAAIALLSGMPTMTTY